MQSLPSAVLRPLITTAPFRVFLSHVAALYQWRYASTQYLGADPNEAQEEEEKLVARQQKLESHDWLLEIFGARLKDDAWQALRDPAVNHDVLRSEAFTVGKRKSQLPEYEVEQANKKRRGGENPPDSVGSNPSPSG
jgi:hypothetical protein